MFQQTKLPRWKGFNLMGMFTSKSPGHFEEEDFQMMADWGFNFVRLPLTYRLWIDDEDEYKINESKLEPLDEAVRWGEKYGIHVNISFHRGPGYSVNKEFTERFNLWTDQEALDCYIYHWTTVAKRYKGEKLTDVSYNLLNEPAGVSPEQHEKVMRAAIKAIHEVDPGRTIILDGLNYGNIPMPELGDLGADNVAQACRAYVPIGVSHYRASWVDEHADFPYPTWPNGKAKNETWSLERLQDHYNAWAGMAEAMGVGVICGEGGPNNTVPHEIALRWMEDYLDILKSCNIGYAQWNLKGGFGILDTNRKDVDYVDYKGHKLDKKMLDLLLKY